MKNKFKVGDMVECIDNYNWDGELTIGKVYECFGCDMAGGDPLIRVKCDNKGLRYIYETRFKLFTEKKGRKRKVTEGKYIVIQGGCGDIICRTNDYEAAITQKPKDGLLTVYKMIPVATLTTEIKVTKIKEKK